MNNLKQKTINSRLNKTPGLEKINIPNVRSIHDLFFIPASREKNINISDAATYNSSIISPKTEKRIKNRSRDKKNMKNTLRFRLFLIQRSSFKISL
jgi:hypothetical protein